MKQKRKVSFKAYACLVLTNIKKGSLFCDVFTMGIQARAGRGQAVLNVGII